VGLLPGPKGTWGSALAVAAALAWLGLGGPDLAGAWYLAFLAALALAAVGVSQACLRARVFGPGHDPQAIVIDEAAGQLIVLYGLSGPVAPEAWLVCLVLFRLCDVLKPWPISASQRLPGGWGVVVDDLLAGLLALALAGLVRWLLPCW
jgi:phosphatidylglycerophosphatase A